MRMGTANGDEAFMESLLCVGVFQGGKGMKWVIQNYEAHFSY